MAKQKYFIAEELALGEFGSFAENEEAAREAAKKLSERNPKSKVFIFSPVEYAVCEITPCAFFAPEYIFETKEKPKRQPRTATNWDVPPTIPFVVEQATGRPMTYHMMNLDRTNEWGAVPNEYMEGDTTADRDRGRAARDVRDRLEQGNNIIATATAGGGGGNGQANFANPTTDPQIEREAYRLMVERERIAAQQIEATNRWIMPTWVNTTEQTEEDNGF